MSNINVRVLTDTSALTSIAKVWDSLLQRAGEDIPIYFTYEWIAMWWKYFGEGKKLNLLLIENEHEVIGIIPLMQIDYRLGLLELSALETIGLECNNCVALVSPGDIEEVVTAFLKYLDDKLIKRNTILRLTPVAENNEFIELLRRRMQQTSKTLLIYECLTNLAPYVSLPHSYDAYLKSLSGNRREHSRRSLRDLQEAHTVEFQQSTCEDLEDRLDKLFELHQKRWQETSSHRWFSNPAVRGFYRDIALQFFKKGWLYFSSLLIDNEIASVEYGYIYKNKLYCQINARDTSYAKYSIGHLHTLHTIKDAIDSGLKECDFLIGYHPHKLRWTKSARRHLEITIVKRGRWPKLHLKLFYIFLRLYEIKQNGLRESYHLRRLKKRNEKELKKMGLAKTII
jgi:CelD/BcsL family acetyltransferase involved in cellulose biosynthesis